MKYITWRDREINKINDRIQDNHTMLLLICHNDDNITFEVKDISGERNISGKFVINYYEFNFHDDNNNWAMSNRGRKSIQLDYDGIHEVKILDASNNCRSHKVDVLYYDLRIIFIPQDEIKQYTAKQYVTRYSKVFYNTWSAHRFDGENKEVITLSKLYE